MLKVDASLPALLDPEGTGRAYVLLRRGISNPAGYRRLWQACGVDPKPHKTPEGVVLATFASAGATWRENTVTLDMILPETVTTQLAGRAATDLIDHPAVQGRIIESARTQGTTQVALLPEYIPLAHLPGVTRRVRIRTWAALLGDRIETLMTWERLRSMARRNEPIGAASMETCDAGLDMTIFIMSMTVISLMLAVVTFFWGVTGHSGEMSLATLGLILAGMSAISLLIAWRLSFEFQVSEDALVMPPWVRIPGTG